VHIDFICDNVSRPAVTKAVSRAKRIGGSIVVKLPEEVVDQEDIHEGEMVEVRKAKKSWFGSMSGIAPLTREDELDVHA
jgi:antitoxin component of MazEF toxin-antitoxin module